MKFAFDGEYSVVALDLNLLERSASVLETIVSTARELERITGVVLSCVLSLCLMKKFPRLWLIVALEANKRNTVVS